MTTDFPLLLKQVDALFESESDFIASTANLSALLYNALDQVNWLGFYLYAGDELVLGPFQGQVACTRITIGQGVCGTAFKQRATLVVPDVHQFDGHIACDVASESEIVVPFSLTADKTTVAGVLDVDSPIKNRFGEAEKEFFEEVVQRLEKSLSYKSF